LPAVWGEKLIDPPLLELAFRKPTMAVDHIEHEIEAPTFNALVCYLYAEHRVLYQLVEQIFFRSPKHGVLGLPAADVVVTPNLPAASPHGGNNGEAMNSGTISRSMRHLQFLLSIRVNAGALARFRSATSTGSVATSSRFVHVKSVPNGVDCLGERFLNMLWCGRAEDRQIVVGGLWP
jgi:hypothetical protein